MPQDILVLVEAKDGKTKKASLELLSEAKKLSGSLKAQVKALVIGQGVSAVATEVGSYGASEIYVADHAELKAYNPERYAMAVTEAVKKSDAAVLLATASGMGRDLLPKVAARLRTGMVSECISMSVKDGKVAGKRPIYAGKCLVEVTIPQSFPQILTCRPNVFEVSAPIGNSSAKVIAIGSEAQQAVTKTKIVETVAGKSDRPDLTEAAIIVSGGRSLKSGENFKILYELADVLGAAVGASRAAVDAGYVGHEMQVGQTGKTVNPTLYFAVGISGAIQHWAGMRTSKVIVAINTDPEAPIFQKANYGIVGDLFTVVPLLTAECKKLLKEG